MSWNGDLTGRELKGNESLCVMPAQAGIQSNVGGSGPRPPLSRGDKRLD
jgi:hypothetical protein